MAGKGVDAGQGEVDLKAVAEKVAQRYGCTVLISGAVDIVSDGTQLRPFTTARHCSRKLRLRAVY